MPGVGVAIAASALLYGLGHYPRNQPLVPALRFRLPAIHHTAPAEPVASATVEKPIIRQLRVPKEAPIGSAVTFTGGGFTGGPLRIDATSGPRPRWKTIATGAIGRDGSYTLRVVLSRRGLIHLRIVYPDGSRSTGAIRVR